MAVAAVEVALALLLLPWRWEDYHRAHGEVATLMAVLLAGHGASAGLLLFAGRRDRRTWLLGGYFLFKATLAPLHMLPAFWGQMPPAHLLQPSVWEMAAPARAFLLLCAYPLAFAVAPAFLWEFARECPRVHRRARLDDLARRMVPVSVAIGCGMCLAVALVYLAGLIDGAGSDAVYVAVLDAAIAIPNVLSLAAVVVIALRARTAPAAEVRRVVLFSAGFLFWAGATTAYDLVETFSPGFWVTNYQSGSVPLLVQPLRFPGMVLLWYSVLAVRVPHLREVIGAGYRRLLTRPGLLGAATAAPAAALGWLLARRPEQAVGTVIADPLTQSLVVMVGFMLLLAIGRERLVQRMDNWIHPETTDQRRVLAAATAALAEAERTTTIRRTVAQAVMRGCGSRAALLLAPDARSNPSEFVAPEGGIPPLPRGTAIAHALHTTRRPLRVDPQDASSVFELLPADEAAWVLEAAADLIVPVPGPGAELGGILVVERRFDDRFVRPVDVPFLEVLGSAAGQAATRLRLLHGPSPGPAEEAPALECPACHDVTGADEPPACSCGSAYVETQVPRRLAGKLRLTRRLGAGGMGSVYLAWDLGLNRHVAVKTLAGVSTADLAGLTPEAWAMAAVTHPAVAQIHGVESWRGRPFLVTEFLPGGTLADRLRRGPVPVPDAVAVTTSLAEALAALHRAAYLHGDVKPSNIGFTAGGAAKLLDFGLARWMHDSAIGGGTVRYLSPEVLSGRPAEAADDVWSLCVVLYEMVTGEHPFADGDDAHEAAARIRRQRLRRIARPSADATTTSMVIVFAASMLTAAPPSRPPTARAFADALDRVARTT